MHPRNDETASALLLALLALLNTRQLISEPPRTAPPLYVATLFEMMQFFITPAGLLYAAPPLL